MIEQINPKIIVYERKFQGLCKKPYRNHPRGCPNFNKKEGCPPQPLLDQIFDFEKDLFVIYTVFQVGEFAERMKQEHPQWSEHPRQWYNPRRWQGRAKKYHKIELEQFLEEDEDRIVNTSPEAHGVNTTDLMSKIGIELKWEWPPNHTNYSENITYRISLGGYSK